MNIQPIDLKQLRVFPLAERKSLTRVDEILLDPDGPPPAVSDETARLLDRFDIATVPHQPWQPQIDRL